ncbi:DNA-3-methyladenine glycosylase I, partial [Faecalitalea cylindroides]|uniref:DNA-3-methyladenine glycosylase I n=1 Tax=Faecalitalea cylindroides TaxID=39483 RepID=UPI00189A7ECE
FIVEACESQECLHRGSLFRNRLKIQATIQNARIFSDIVKEKGSFRAYLEEFTDGKIYYETNLTHSTLSDAISKDLKKKGMKFVGTTIIYSYL